MKVRVLKPFRLLFDKREKLLNLSSLQYKGDVIDLPEERAKNAIASGLVVKTNQSKPKSNGKSESGKTVHRSKKRTSK